MTEEVNAPSTWQIYNSKVNIVIVYLVHVHTYQGRAVNFKKILWLSPIVLFWFVLEAQECRCIDETASNKQHLFTNVFQFSYSDNFSFDFVAQIAYTVNCT